MIHLLEPAEGWERLPDHTPIINAVFEALRPGDEEGAWRYYNFTSDTSIWSSDLPETNWLFITYLAIEPKERVAELRCELTPTQDPLFTQLQQLIQRLQREFGLRMSDPLPE